MDHPAKPQAQEMRGEDKWLLIIILLNHQWSMWAQPANRFGPKKHSPSVFPEFLQHVPLSNIHTAKRHSLGSSWVTEEEEDDGQADQRRWPWQHLTLWIGLCEDCASPTMDDRGWWAWQVNHWGVTEGVKQDSFITCADPYASLIQGFVLKSQHRGWMCDGPRHCKWRIHQKQNQQKKV